MNTYAFAKNSTCIKILLLAHGAADNLGDQIIEACSDAMIQAVMTNLNIPSEQYEVLPIDANFVYERSLSAEPVEIKKVAERLIREADIIIFGGAPMFNYKYERLAERTADTMELIQKYKKPVFFSAIGVENFETDNPVCMRLKNSLNTDCVKMITTRDNYEALLGFTQGTAIPCAKVSDSAVHTCTVFQSFQHSKDRTKKKIGLFVIRGNAFKDNGIKFESDEAKQMWLKVAEGLEKRGYDYEFLTSGSAPDELLVEQLIVEHGVDEKKCVTNINTPEELVNRISSYDGIIACRLHPSIIAYSLKVPSVALIWNEKVSNFYEGIGYAKRCMPAAQTSSEEIIRHLEEAMVEGVTHDEDYLMSSYVHLFNAMKALLLPEKPVEVFSYQELIANMPFYQGSNLKEKLDWKFAKVYRDFYRNFITCRRRAAIIQKNQKAYDELLQQYNALEQNYMEACKMVSEIKDALILQDE